MVSDVEVRVVQRIGLVSVLHTRPVIHERANRQSRRERRHAADMIGVVMRDDEVVDARDACLLRRRRDAVGVTAAESREAGVDEHRLAGRRHEQRGLSPFDVDEIDAQGLAILRGRSLRRRNGDRGGEQAKKDGAHAHKTIITKTP